MMILWVHITVAVHAADSEGFYAAAVAADNLWSGRLLIETGLFLSMRRGCLCAALSEGRLTTSNGGIPSSELTIPA